MKPESALKRRLRSYWKMEAGCAVLFPLLTLISGPEVRAWREAMALAVALAACCALLFLGAAYWRASLRRLEGHSTPMRTVLQIAARTKTCS